MMNAIFTKEEIEAMHKAKNGKRECCFAQAEAAMNRVKINFDDIEHINGIYESHKWGSDADRAYRKRAIKKAISRVAENPEEYASE